MNLCSAKIAISSAGRVNENFVKTIGCSTFSQFFQRVGALQRSAFYMGLVVTAKRVSHVNTQIKWEDVKI